MSRKSTNPVGLTEANYPHAAWWVAATSAEVGKRPLQRWILDYPVVLFRGDDERPVALDDRCPHRWAPLSLGTVKGNDIACGYHGFRFGADGRCTHVPTQDLVPGVARVRSYPVVEAAPFVWIWTGEPDQAAAAPPRRRSNGRSIDRGSPPAGQWRSPATSSRSRKMSSISVTSRSSMRRRSR